VQFSEFAATYFASASFAVQPGAAFETPSSRPAYLRTRHTINITLLRTSHYIHTINIAYLSTLQIIHMMNIACLRTRHDIHTMNILRTYEHVITFIL
jgi:hypothetical protein